MSDHRMIKATLRYGDSIPENKKEPEGFEALNFQGRVDWDAVRKQLAEAAWEATLQVKTVFEMLVSIIDIMLTISKRHVPCKSSKKRGEIPRVRRSL